MVVGAFPTVKLAVLLFKQISKPIANFAKERAKNNRFFRTYVCMPPAQFYNWCEIKSKMWIMNLGKPVNVPVLNEQMAIELGANLLGEGIIYILGSVLLILEWNRSSKKEAAKEEERLAEMVHLNDMVKELYFTVQSQDTQLRQLQRNIGELETRVVVKPWALLKNDGKGSGEEPPGGTPQGNMKSSENDQVPANQSSSGNPQVQNMSAPYPSRGIVLQSLNYVELDILNTPQEEMNKNIDEALNGRKPGLILQALNYIETDLKGLL